MIIELSLAKRGNSDILEFKLVLEPYARMHLARMFPYYKINKHVYHNKKKDKFVPVYARATAQNAKDLEWFFFRFKPQMNKETEKVFNELVTEANRIIELKASIDKGFKLEKETILKPTGLIKLREYQEFAVNYALITERMILGDETGLGKTFVALGLAEKLGKTVIFCDPHVVSQFKQRCKEYFKDAKVYEVKRCSPTYSKSYIKDGERFYEFVDYIIPEADIYIISYSKCRNTEIAEMILNKGIKFVCFDECQALRRRGSLKYEFCEAFKTIPHIVGLSATPLFNYGNEIFNIFRIIDQNALGQEIEFMENWSSDGKIVSNPKALGNLLKESKKFLKRTKQEVYGENTMKIERGVYYVDFNSLAYKRYENLINQLSHTVVTGSFEEAGAASYQLNTVLRKQTGLAKAKGVANFVRVLLENEKKVVLCGWHREVYEVWLNELSIFSPVLYTGSESPKQKDANKKAFVEGDSKLLILSLRSGQGLDGLQHASSDIVFGELDWSPAVHKQCEGRLHRDGQKDLTSAFYLTSNSGCDPFMLNTLGVKASQSEGIINPDDMEDFTEKTYNPKNIKLLAQNILNKNVSFSKDNL